MEYLLLFKDGHMEYRITDSLWMYEFRDDIFMIMLKIGTFNTEQYYLQSPRHMCMRFVSVRVRYKLMMEYTTDDNYGVKPIVEVDKDIETYDDLIKLIFNIYNFDGLNRVSPMGCNDYGDNVSMTIKEFHVETRFYGNEHYSRPMDVTLDGFAAGTPDLQKVIKAIEWSVNGGETIVDTRMGDIFLNPTNDVKRTFKVDRYSMRWYLVDDHVELDKKIFDLQKSEDIAVYHQDFRTFSFITRHDMKYLRKLKADHSGNLTLTVLGYDVYDDGSGRHIPYNEPISYSKLKAHEMDYNFEEIESFSCSLFGASDLIQVLRNVQALSVLGCVWAEDMMEMQGLKVLIEIRYTLIDDPTQHYEFSIPAEVAADATGDVFTKFMGHLEYVVKTNKYKIHRKEVPWFEDPREFIR